MRGHPAPTTGQKYGGRGPSHRDDALGPDVRKSPDALLTPDRLGGVPLASSEVRTDDTADTTMAEDRVALLEMPRKATAGGGRRMCDARSAEIGPGAGPRRPVLGRRSYAKNATMVAVSSEKAQRSTALPSRMWKISAVRYWSVRSPRVAVAVPSAIAWSSLAMTS